MHSFLLSSEHDLANFLKEKKFEKVFILCGKKILCKLWCKEDLK